MWLFTRHGFYSVVEKPKGTLCVRSRSAKDLEALMRLAHLEPKAILSNVGTDYPHRILLDPSEWLTVMEALAKDVTYPNFKASVADARVGLYHDIWARVRRWYTRGQ